MGGLGSTRDPLPWSTLLLDVCGIHDKREGFRLATMACMIFMYNVFLDELILRFVYAMYFLIHTLYDVCINLIPSQFCFRLVI